MITTKPAASPVQGRMDGDLQDRRIRLPASLRRYGQEGRYSLLGRADAPILILLGGISADRFPCRRPDGSPGWWHQLAAAGGPFDPADYRILGIDFLFDPSGKCAPTTHEQAAFVSLVLDALDVERAHAVIGASYGGMIALALGEREPVRVERLVVLSADGSPHPASTALRELQRRVVALGIERGAPDEALAIARGFAMLSYRTPAEFEARFDEGLQEESPLGCTSPGAYLRARGAAFAQATPPARFLSLSASIDRHRVDPQRIKAPTLLIGADNDQLVPIDRMEKLAAILPTAQLHRLQSLFGHDMFLKDCDRLAPLIATFLDGRS